MKYIVMALLLMSCGDDNYFVSASCSTSKVGNTTSIDCTDGTHVEVKDGEPGAAGINGTNGSTITPVKFCNTDHSAFPEYGLLIGDQLYAVYWGSTPSSSAPQAFLALLTPGSYRSTGGNNCSFTINADNSVSP